jgi:hypothetical protein
MHNSMQLEEYVQYDNMKSFICQMEISPQVKAFQIFVSNTFPFLLTFGENFALHEGNSAFFFYNPQTA